VNPRSRYLRSVGVGSGLGLLIIVIGHTARGSPPLIGLITLLELLAFIGISALLALPSLVLDARRSRSPMSSLQEHADQARPESGTKPGSGHGESPLH
jgi:hypothetical protein